MLVNLFEVEDQKLVPGYACYGIPWLKRIMDLYPDNYIQIYKYIFYTTCPDGTINPYVNLPEDEREAVVMSDLAPIKFSLDDEVIVNTVDRCKMLYETPVLRTFLGAKKMLDKVGRFLDSEEITTGKDGSGPFITSTIEKLPSLNKAFNDAVHVSRAYAGLPKLADAKGVGEPENQLIRLARAPFRILAVQRLFHSVEMVIVILLFQGSALLISYGLYLALFVTVGHLVSILSSRKLSA